MVSRIARAAAVAIAIASVAFAPPARAQEPPPESETGDLSTPTLAAPVAPPPLETPFLQYGVAFTAEFVPSAGAMCADEKDPCILGSGGGIAMRVGRRSAGPWYFGGAYELTKQDPRNLYRLATLQQLRGEARWYLPTGRDTQPYASAGAGLAAYGNEMRIDTWGPAFFLAIGTETQLSRATVIGFALAYRAVVFDAFRDSSGADRQAGIAHFVGLDLALEGRDPL